MYSKKKFKDVKLYCLKNCPENPIIDHENIELLIINADIKLYFCIYLTLKIVVKEKSEG